MVPDRMERIGRHEGRVGVAFLPGQKKRRQLALKPCAHDIHEEPLDCGLLETRCGVESEELMPVLRFACPRENEKPLPVAVASLSLGGRNDRQAGTDDRVTPGLEKR